MITRDNSRIKICFWIFLFLLLTEGIFRRWLLPNMNNVFLVARDPFVFYAIFVGYRAGLLRDKPAIVMLILSILCFFSAMLFGHGNVLVAMYGMRILLYYPFIYITARVLTRDDILKVGRFFVLLIIPMTILCMVQFASPQSSIVNIGIGGDESGAGFGTGALGFFRPPGIFTFITALTDYYGISLSFLLYFLSNKQVAEKLHLSKGVLLISVFFYIISIPVSISRTHFVQTALICFFYFLASTYDPNTRQKGCLSIVVIIVISIIIMSVVPDIDLYIEVFSERFNSANTTEGGLFASAYERSFGWALRALEKTTIMGYGDGYFTNVGMMILQGDTSDFSGDLAKIADATEMEWGRILCEDGLIFGSLILMTRFYISFDLFIKAKSKLKHCKDQLPWLLLPFTMYLQFFGQLKAPYNLGFCAIISICCIAVVQRKKLIEISK